MLSVNNTTPIRSGSLTVVGIGLKFVGHVTVETRAYIEQADRVFLVLSDVSMAAWVQEVNPSAEWFPFYTERERQHDTYQEWLEQIHAAIERLLAPVREGLKVCLVFHGHPAVCVLPAHEAIRLARSEGLHAQMLPGLSAEDCLFADLGVDPLQDGCQSFEAADFLLRRRPFSTASALILRQIGLIGELAQMRRLNTHGLRVLVEVLAESYGADHEVVVYEAAPFPIVEPMVKRVPLAKVPEAQIRDRSTLYVPPKTTLPIDPDMLDRLGMPLSRVRGVEAIPFK